MSGNVANQELCRELYKLSAWGSNYENTASPDYELDWYGANKTYECPKYPLGYLLRKLPLVIKQEDQEGFLTMTNDGEDYHFSYGWWFEPDRMDEVEGADRSPENAVCKLAIQLFKEGILTR
jgi:hypothetical protein